jgi:hypothetical protein
MALDLFAASTRTTIHPVSRRAIPRHGGTGLVAAVANAPR